MFTPLGSPRSLLGLPGSPQAHSFWALCIMFTPLDNPAGISPGSAWYFYVLCLLRWIILPGSPQDQFLCIMFTPLDNPAGISPGSTWYFNVYSAGISPESPRPAGISPGSFIFCNLRSFTPAGISPGDHFKLF